MSIATDAKVRELERRVAVLETLAATIGVETQPSMPADLVQRYMQKFGKKPHHFMKEDSIRKALT